MDYVKPSSGIFARAPIGGGAEVKNRNPVSRIHTQKSGIAVDEKQNRRGNGAESGT